jgi:hypothetical protein
VRAIIDGTKWDRLTDPPPNDARFMQCRARQQNGEFLSTDAAGDIAWAQIPLKPVGNLKQTAIANACPHLSLMRLT